MDWGKFTFYGIVVKFVVYPILTFVLGWLLPSPIRKRDPLEDLNLPPELLSRKEPNEKDLPPPSGSSSLH